MARGIWVSGFVRFRLWALGFRRSIGGLGMWVFVLEGSGV